MTLVVLLTYPLGTHKVLLLPPLLLCLGLYPISFRFMDLHMTRLMPLLALLALGGCTASMPKQQARVDAKLIGQSYSVATARMGKPVIDQPYPDGLRRLQRFALSSSIRVFPSVTTSAYHGTIGLTPVSGTVRSVSYADGYSSTAYCDLSIITDRSQTIIETKLLGDADECGPALKKVL